MKIVDKIYIFILENVIMLYPFWLLFGIVIGFIYKNF